MLRILKKKISNGDLLKSIVLLPSVIISSYASNKKTKLEDIEKTSITNQQEIEIQLKTMEKSIKKCLTKNEEMLKLENKLTDTVPVIQKTEEVKIDSTSLDTSSLEILNNPLLQTSLTLMGIIGIGYLSYSYLPKITAIALLKAQELDNETLLEITIHLIMYLLLMDVCIHRRR